MRWFGWVLLGLALAVRPCSGAVFDTVNDYISNGSAEANWTDWFHALNASIATDSVGPGSKCFQLEPTAGVHSDIRTGFLPAQAQDKFVLRYDFKSSPGAGLEAGSSLIAVRSYGDNDTFLGQDQFPFQITDGQWMHFEHEIETQPGCHQIDVWFIANGFGAQQTTGQYRIDNVELHRFIPSLSRHIGALPDQLYVMRQSYLNDADFVLMQSLQGLLAQSKPEIWIDQGDMTLVEDMVTHHGLSYTRVDSLFWYLNRYKSRVDGYILYDFSDKASITAANSLAGIMNAVMVEDSLQSYVESLGYTQVFDARGKNDEWVYNNYWNDFTHDLIIVRTDDTSFHPAAYFFRDWGVAVKGLFWWNDNESLCRQVYNSVVGNAPCYGWTDGTTGSELESIRFHSESGLYQVPADWLLNLSTLAGMAKRPEPWQFTQPVRANTYTMETGVHYVTFKMSDMDNVLTLIAAHNFSTNANYFANSHRGSFAMGWGMPPSLVELAPSAVERWYRLATNKDSFAAPTSGLGYTYPHRWPEHELKANTLKLNALMQQADLRTLVISDDLWPTTMNALTYGHVAEKFAAMEQVQGMFYLDVNGDYARFGREADAGRAQRIYWFNDKPFVPCRYTLWDGGQYEGISRDGLQLAASINALPTDPSNPDSYTFVMVHAWSYGLDEIATCIANLDPDVRVVNMEEFIKQIRMNFLPCNDNRPTADLDGDCAVDYVDLGILADEWLQSEPVNADFNGDAKVDFEDFAEFCFWW